MLEMETRRSVFVFVFFFFFFSLIVIGSKYAESLDTTNLALNRPAVQSSTIRNGFCGGELCNASLAVDGIRDTDFSYGSCSHTEEYADSWWRVDLGKAFRIRMVVVTNRIDCCGERLNYFIVGVTNSTEDPVRGAYPLCNQYPSTTPAGANLTLECNPDTNAGRFVIIQQPSNEPDFLTLCEVEVYAGNVTCTHTWKRHCDQRLNTSSPAVYLSKPSAPHCVYECERTSGCDSVNYQPTNDTCVLNFDVYGATPGDLITAQGWIWWTRKYQFI